MEILKTQLDDQIVKIQIGTEVNEAQTAVSGSVELDIENQGLFVDIINAAFDEGHNKLIIDMNNISYIDSSGLWALFEGHKKAAQKNGRMVLLSPSKDVKRVLDITKISSKMQLFDTESLAVESLKQ